MKKRKQKKGGGGEIAIGEFMAWGKLLHRTGKLLALSLMISKKWPVIFGIV